MQFYIRMCRCFSKKNMGTSQFCSDQQVVTTSNSEVNPIHFLVLAILYIYYIYTVPCVGPGSEINNPMDGWMLWMATELLAPREHNSGPITPLPLLPSIYISSAAQETPFFLVKKQNKNSSNE